MGPSIVGRLSVPYRGVAGQQRTYALVSDDGKQYRYVIAGSGVDLTSHVKRRVELGGRTYYDQNLRAYVTIVTQVRDLP